MADDQKGLRGNAVPFDGEQGHQSVAGALFASFDKQTNNQAIQ